MNKRFIGVVTLFCAVLLLASCATTQIATLKEISNPEAPFKVDVWTDRSSASFAIGDEITYIFKANKECYVTVFNVTADGKVQVVFPNQFQKDNKVKGGATIRVLPDAAKKTLTVAGPAGTNTIKAVATLENKTVFNAADMKAAGMIWESTKPQSEVATFAAGVLGEMDKKNWAQSESTVTITKD